MYHPTRSAMLTDLVLDPTALASTCSATLKSSPWLILALVPLSYLVVGGGAILAVAVLIQRFWRRLRRRKEM